MPKKKKTEEVESVEEPVVEQESGGKSEKEKLLEVYQFMKDYKINSISNIENLIARS